MSAEANVDPAAPQTSVPAWKQIVLFGDSITEMSSNQELGYGFAPAVQAAYVRRADVINRGLSGYNTRQAVKCLPWIIPTPTKGDMRLMVSTPLRKDSGGSSSYVDSNLTQTLFFGANDAAGDDNPQHVPLAEYGQNLKAIIHHPLVTAHNAKVVLIGLPPCNESQLVKHDRWAERTRQYADACRAVAQSEGVPFVDLWSVFMQAVGWSEGQPLLGKDGVAGSEKLEALLSDGVHLTAAGYRLVYQEFSRVVAEQLPECTPAAFPSVLPPWNQYYQPA